MVKKQRSPSPLGPEDWLEAALRLVTRTGVKGLKVQELAASLGATTGSLYWHFQDRADLLDALLEHWVRRSTVEVIDRALAANETPEARLLHIMKEVLDNEATTSDLAFRAWALTSRRAAHVVARVDRAREETARHLFGEMGFEGVEREMRVRLLLCYEACERVVHARLSRKKRLELLEARHGLLCRRDHD